LDSNYQQHKLKLKQQRRTLTMTMTTIMTTMIVVHLTMTYQKMVDVREMTTIVTQTKDVEVKVWTA
jgi:hypothetical protein